MRTALLALLGIPCTVFFTLAALAGGLFRASSAYFDWVHRSWAKSMLWVVGVRVEADGLENLPVGEPVILAVNHQSWIDIFVLLASLPVSVRFIAKKEIRRVPGFASAMESAGHVFVDRKKRGKAIVAMRKAAAHMRDQGHSMAIFPEGTRSPDGRLLPFKKGGFVLAIEIAATLVPVAMDGGRLIMPKNTLAVRAGRVRLRCAKAIRFTGPEKDDRDNVLEDVRDRIARMLEEIRVSGAATPRT
jgi:1-acyl-sn-glycerol-3-phosphate acyltransferase